MTEETEVIAHPPAPEISTDDAIPVPPEILLWEAANLPGEF